MVRSSLPRLSRHSAAPCVAAAVGLAMLATLLLGGCTPEAVAPTPIPVPPVPDGAWFASDEEALAAAHKTYTAYLAAADRAADGAIEARAAYQALSIGELHRQVVEVAELYDSEGWTSIGRLTHDSMAIQTFGFVQPGEHEIRTLVCLDVSETDVLDSTGASVVEPDRVLRLPLQVVFQQSNQKGPILLSESKVWSGKNFC